MIYIYVVILVWMVPLYKKPRYPHPQLRNNRFCNACIIYIQSIMAWNLLDAKTFWHKLKWWKNNDRKMGNSGKILIVTSLILLRLWNQESTTTRMVSFFWRAYYLLFYFLVLSFVLIPWFVNFKIIFFDTDYSMQLKNAFLTALIHNHIPPLYPSPRTKKYSCIICLTRRINL